MKGLVTKEEFNIAVAELKAQIQEIKIDLKDIRNEIATTKLELNSKIDLLGKELTIKIGYMLAASIGLIVALTKLV
jgi:tetrahydromethanopterin S-methyltransferase subunit G